MPQLKEIIEKERERGTAEQCATIHLFREGTFFRAYEWSARALIIPENIYASKCNSGVDHSSYEDVVKAYGADVMASL